VESEEGGGGSGCDGRGVALGADGEREVGGEEGIERERPGERAGLGIIKDGWPRVEVGSVGEFVVCRRTTHGKDLFAVCLEDYTRQTISLPCVLNLTHGKLFLYNYI